MGRVHIGRYIHYAVGLVVGASLVLVGYDQAGSQRTALDTHIHLVVDVPIATHVLAAHLNSIAIGLIKVGNQLLQGIFALAGVLIPKDDFLSLGIEGFETDRLLVNGLLLAATSPQKSTSNQRHRTFCFHRVIL